MKTYYYRGLYFWYFEVYLDANTLVLSLEQQIEMGSAVFEETSVPVRGLLQDLVHAHSEGLVLAAFPREIFINPELCCCDNFALGNAGKIEPKFSSVLLVRNILIDYWEDRETEEAIEVITQHLTDVLYQDTPFIIINKDNYTHMRSDLVLPASADTHTHVKTVTQSNVALMCVTLPTSRKHWVRNRKHPALRAIDLNIG